MTPGPDSLCRGCFDKECFAKQPKGVTGLSESELKEIDDWVAFYDKVCEHVTCLIWNNTFDTCLCRLTSTWASCPIGTSEQCPCSRVLGAAASSYCAIILL